MSFTAKQFSMQKTNQCFLKAFFLFLPREIVSRVSRVIIVMLQDSLHPRANAGKVFFVLRVRIVLILLSETAMEGHAQKVTYRHLFYKRQLSSSVIEYIYASITLYLH